LPRITGRLLSDGITLAIVWIFLFQGHSLAKKWSDSFSPEAEATSLLVNLLEEIPDQENVIIIPRREPNVSGEPLLRAIFANSMKLDPNDSRLIYHPSEIAQQKKRAGYLLSFDYKAKKYILTRRLREEPPMQNGF
jgi:hypothetical protein